jgi:ABC-type transporter MlaC component
MRIKVDYLLEQNTLTGRWRVVSVAPWGSRLNTYEFRTRWGAERFRKGRLRQQDELGAWEQVVDS